MQRDLLVCFLVFFPFICPCHQCQQATTGSFIHRKMNNGCKRTLGSTLAAAENKCGHLGKFSINEKAGKSGGRTPDEKATEGYFISNPLFNMLLSLPSSIKTNDLSCARHRGAKPWSCFPERRGVMDFHMPKLFEMLMKQGKQTRGEQRQTPASLRQMQRCRRKNDSTHQRSGLGADGRSENRDAAPPRIPLALQTPQSSSDL